LPGIVGAHVSWSIATTSGDVGRVAEAIEAAEAGYRFVTRSFDAPHMGCFIAVGHVGALLLSGCVMEAQEVAERLRQQAADLPGAAPLLATAIAGRAALGAGRLDTACSLLGTVVESLPFSHDSDPWRYLFQLPRAIALAMRGAAAEAAAVLAALPTQGYSRLHWADYEKELGWAWTTAAQGAVSGAISRSLSAAGIARANNRFAVEVLCLQTAAQFGYRSSAARLGKLAAIVEGPRAGVAARFAAALDAGEGAELVAVSGEFERMGDLVTALDAAAHAAVAYRRQGLRGSALGCSARAEALAQQCGASTPALRAATEQSPLSDREREIVTLIGEGLSNGAIAERLTLSKRTVESHIYRAMAKTGATSRDELAAVIPRRRSIARE
jgi:DNA-binding CsgD family transcriptional regulator